MMLNHAHYKPERHPANQSNHPRAHDALLALQLSPRENALTHANERNRIPLGLIERCKL